MPCAARRWAGRESRSTCPSIARPVAGTAPISPRRSVVLPAPLRPISPHISPSLSASAASRRIGTGPIATLRFATSSMGALRLWAEIEPGTDDQRLHLGVGEGRLRRAVGDDGAVVKRQHALGVAGDDGHVVLDEQDGDAPLLERRPP